MKYYKYHFLIILCFLVYLFYTPNYYSNIEKIINSIILCLIIFVSIFCINKVTNKGDISLIHFKIKTKQKIFLIVLFALFLTIFILNGGIISLLKTFKLSSFTLFITIFTAILSGFMEEYFVRGYLFNMVLNKIFKYKYSLTYTSLITSIIFALLHFNNMFIGHSSLQLILQQVFYSFCFGILFSGIRIATNNLYITAILHTLFNMQPPVSNQQVQPSTGSWLLLLIMFLPLLLFGIYFLISIDKTHINKLKNNF